MKGQEAMSPQPTPPGIRFLSHQLVSLEAMARKTSPLGFTMESEFSCVQNKRPEADTHAP